MSSMQQQCMHFEQCTVSSVKDQWSATTTAAVLRQQDAAAADACDSSSMHQGGAAHCSALGIHVAAAKTPDSAIPAAVVLQYTELAYTVSA